MTEKTYKSTVKNEFMDKKIELIKESDIKKLVF